MDVHWLVGGAPPPFGRPRGYENNVCRWPVVEAPSRLLLFGDGNSDIYGVWPQVGRSGSRRVPGRADLALPHRQVVDSRVRIPGDERRNEKRGSAERSRVHQPPTLLSRQDPNPVRSLACRPPHSQ